MCNCSFYTNVINNDENYKNALNNNLFINLLFLKNQNETGSKYCCITL